MGGSFDEAGPAISYGSKNKYRGGLGAGSADDVGQSWDTGTGSAIGEDVAGVEIDAHYNADDKEECLTICVAIRDQYADLTEVALAPVPPSRRYLTLLRHGRRLLARTRFAVGAAGPYNSDLAKSSPKKPVKKDTLTSNGATFFKLLKKKADDEYSRTCQ
ncbi:hypothetical protein V501_03899 [Pseudogymnoascus sp. VKM F-4519 (FW-2642)]|nr:hypothetical protein V501_03899 [Pseudogymnoascus sp. VKM F-4519 (FW-2642)]